MESPGGNDLNSSNEDGKNQQRIPEGMVAPVRETQWPPCAGPASVFPDAVGKQRIRKRIRIFKPKGRLCNGSK
jgi:hypothetical protein